MNSTKRLFYHCLTSPATAQITKPSCHVAGLIDQCFPPVELSFAGLPDLSFCDQLPAGLNDIMTAYYWILTNEF